MLTLCAVSAFAPPPRPTRQLSKRGELPDGLDDPTALQAARRHVDGPYSLVMIGLFRLAFGAALNSTPTKEGWFDAEESYGGLVTQARTLYQTLPSAAARKQTVADLLGAFPSEPQLLGNNRLSMEALAQLTSRLFPFLVGSCHVEAWEDREESADAPTPWRSKVVIERCRFLEASSCKGMCVGLCKEPSEAFFGSIGLPLSMVPNLEDGSCEMTWGRTPLETDLDGANLACFSACDLTLGPMRMPTSESADVRTVCDERRDAAREEKRRASSE